MGDNEKLYINEDIVNVILEDILPLADIITPNQFEAEIISGVKITDESSALLAIKKMLQKYPKLESIVITSTSINSEKLIGYGYKKDEKVVRFETEMIESQFVGTGDLYLGFFIAYYFSEQPKFSFKQVLEKCNDGMNTILKYTLDTMKRFDSAKRELNFIPLRKKIMESIEKNDVFPNVTRTKEVDMDLIQI